MEDQSIYSNPQRLFAAMTQGNPNIPTPSFPSLSEVQNHAKKYAKAIFADRQALLEILERYVLRIMSSSHFGLATLIPFDHCLPLVWPF